MPFSSKDMLGRKMSESQKTVFSPRHSSFRNVFSPVGTQRKSSVIVKTDTSTKNMKRSVTPSVRGVMSQITTNTHSSLKSKTSLMNKNSLEVKRSSHGCVTVLDNYRLKNKPVAVSRTLPHKELVLNSYHQDCHIAQWKSWLGKTPEWMRKIVLEEKRKRKHFIFQADKENRPVGNESTNSSYTTIEDELLETSGIDDEPITQDIISEERRQWRDWSIQLSEGKLLITGKFENGVHKSEDVSSCELVDPNTLRFNNGLVYELVGMPDHFTNLPYYVRNKFQVGFPDDWKLVKDLWLNYIKEGSPFDFNWSASTNSSSYETSPVEDTYLRSSEIGKTPGNSVTNDEFRTYLSSRLDTLANVSSEKLNNTFKLPHTPVMTERYKKTCSAFMKESVIKAHSSSSLQLDNSKMSKAQGAFSAKSENNISESQSSTLPVEAAEIKQNATSVTPAEDFDSKPQSSKVLPTKINNKLEKLQIDQEVTLHDWTPILDNGDFKIKGYTKSGLNRGTIHITDVIEARKSYDSFRCKNGSNYKLLGKFVDPENRIPSEIKKKLVKGLPLQWKMMVKNWAIQLSTEK